MGLDAMILDFWMLSFKPLYHKIIKQLKHNPENVSL